jgi:Protein of unknown function (DUF3634)
MVQIWYYKYIVGADALMIINSGKVEVGFGQFSLSFINDCKVIAQDTNLVNAKLYLKKENEKTIIGFSKEVVPSQQQRFRNAYFF